MMLALLFAVATLLGVAFFVFKDKQIAEESYEASNPTPVATPEDLAMLGLSQQIEKDPYSSPASATFTTSPGNTWKMEWTLPTPKVDTGQYDKLREFFNCDEEKPKKTRKKSKKKTKKKPIKKTKKRK